MLRTHWLRRRLTAVSSAHRSVAPAATALLSTLLLSAAPAQPPGPPPDAPPPEHRDPLRGALDANHDFELDADEIAKAPEAIRKLDRNGDGRLDREEMRPPMGPPPGGPGRGAEGRGPEGRPRPREGGRPETGGPGDRPSPERFLERVKSFDADGDGKLDEGELKKWAESMAERMRGRGPGGGGPPRDGERPERPRRPE